MTEQSDKPSVDGRASLVRDFDELMCAHAEWLTTDVIGARYIGLLRSFKERLAALAGPPEQPQSEQPNSSYSVSPVPSEVLLSARPFPPGSTLALSLAIQALEAEPPTGREWPVNWPLVIYGLKGIKGAIEANGELNADQ